MASCNPVATPLDSHTRLYVDSAERLSTEAAASYEAIVGSLLYLTVMTRPDIAFAVGMLSRFMATPDENHLQAAKRVFRYLKGAPQYGLHYAPTATTFGFVDFRLCLRSLYSSFDHRYDLHSQWCCCTLIQ